MKLLMAAAMITGCATISSAADLGLTTDDPVLVRIAGSDLQDIGSIQKVGYSIFIENYSEDSLQRLNQNEWYLNYAFHYARQICYGRRTDDSFTLEDSQKEPKPEMIELASAGLNGLVFEFACSDE